MSMYSFIGFMAIIILATILACGYAILKRIDKIDEKWKPSKKQMNELHRALIPGCDYDCDVLQELYFDLKKLMEE